MMKKSISCLLMMGSVLSMLFAQERHRLTKGWEFIRQDMAVWEVIRPAAPGSPESVPLWDSVSLPHCFNAFDAVNPDVNYYQGPGWYRTRIPVNNPYQQGRTLLHFEGAGQKTQVYIYNRKVGEHTGGYDEWTLDITEAIAHFLRTDSLKERFKGLVPLSIRCDNSRDPEMIPSDMSDFNLYGGLYRHVNLEYQPPLSLDKFFAEASTDRKGKQGLIKLRLRVYNPEKLSNAQVNVRLLDPEGKDAGVLTKTLSLTSDELDLGELLLKHPALWSPDNPRRYKLQLTLKSGNQQSSEQIFIGFRQFEFLKQGPFLLNGQRLLLRGTHRHEDQAGVAAAMTDEQISQEMHMIKDMGVNFIRLAHYQQSRRVLEACDSLGILVWEEIPWCRGGLGGERYQAQARQMLTHMIEQHYNHPAVIIWGLGNENDWAGDFPEFDKQKIRAFMSSLNQLAHQLDPSRKTAIRRCDFCRDIVDVYSPSIWAGWYRGIYTDYRESTETERKRVDHFLHAEWGGDSHAGRHAEDPGKGLGVLSSGKETDERAGDASFYGGAARASKDGDWSETYICDVFDWHLREQETMPQLSGSAFWVFKDFSTPLRPENPVPYVNQKGVVTRDMTKKEAYYVFQSYWTEKPMVHIYGHSWPVRWGNSEEQKLVKVYSNAEQAELFLNGQSQGIRKRNSADFPASGLRWMVNFKDGLNHLFVKASKGNVVVSDSIDQNYQTQKWGTPARLVLEQRSVSQDTITVEARLTDSAGVLCLDAKNAVRFELAGDGKLLADLGTPDGSRLVQLYNGRALIRLLTGEGSSIVSVASKGLPTAFLPLGISPAGARDTVIHTLHDQVMKEADWAMNQQPVTVTATVASRSAGGPHDFYSEGDYWWPDPAHPDGPYIRRDGMTNPDNFVAHREAMVRFSRIVGVLCSAWVLTHDRRYADKAIAHIKAWFVDTATRMNPSLLYAQAIKGHVTGRGIGIIDTIHLLEVARALGLLEEAGAINTTDLRAAKVWFSDYTKWLTTHAYGLDEMNAKNNHGTCWVLQVAAFAKLTGNDSLVRACADRYKNVLLPSQMTTNGSFPLELERTKPYGYSLFNLDAMAVICRLLSSDRDNLWKFQLSDGRSIRRGIDFMKPYIQDKQSWPYAHDVLFWDNWPVAQPALLLGGLAYADTGLLSLWQKLEHAPAEAEVLRNLPLRYPLLWL